jgi:hypothetical protein
MQILRGVAHVHSTYSYDGRLPLSDLAGFMSGQGLDFVLMSEHVESLDPEKVHRFVEDCSRLSNERFLLIPGIEIDELNALFYGIQAPGGWEDTQDLARQLAAGGALVAVSHPVKIRKEISEITKSAVEAVEVWNSRHDGKVAPRRGILNYWMKLRAGTGRQLLPLCGIDFHDKRDFVPLVMEVECDGRDRDSILAGIREGRYRIALGGEDVPLDFGSGALPLSYRAYSALYGAFYESVYFFHRAAGRLRLRPPKRLKSWLRRKF